jgi:hypothetical protein
MLAITDAKGITYSTNEYDANDRVTKQTTSRHRRAETASGPWIRGGIILTPGLSAVYRGWE